MVEDKRICRIAISCSDAIVPVSEVNYPGRRYALSGASHGCSGFLLTIVKIDISNQVPVFSLKPNINFKF